VRTHGSTIGWLASLLLGCMGVAMAPTVAVAATPTSSSTATAPAPATGLRFVPGSTRKVEQLVGDVDLATKRPTVSRTEKRFGIGGTDLGSSFEHEGKLYFLFGDTVSRSGGGDAMGTTAAKSGEGGVRLDFVTGANGKWLRVKPPGVDMDAVEVPLAGVSVGGEIYLMVKTNHTTGASPDASTDISKLVHFDDQAKRFRVLRDVSRLPAGHFVQVSLHHATDPIAGLPEPGPSVLMWGTGIYRKSNAYLAVTPAETFATGGPRPARASGTRYFAGLDAAGEPTWDDDESRAAPLFEQPEIGDLSVSFVPELDLWLMLYDVWPGRSDRADRWGGVQLRTSATPWGPWSAPEQVLGLVDAKEGKLVHMANTDDGLEWPLVDSRGQSRNSVQGAPYAPYMVERFTRVDRMGGNRVKLYYLLSTWNPYVVVLMRSEFTVRRPVGRPAG
jgi:hypothetical protein